MGQIFKYQVIEIQLNTTALSYKFPDQPNLRNAVIDQIEVYTPAFISKSPITYGTMPTLADLQKCYLVLNVGSDQDVQKRPALLFSQVNDGTSPFVTFMDGIRNKIFSWDKCTVEFASAPTLSVLSLGVYYDDTREGYLRAMAQFYKEKGNRDQYMQTMQALDTLNSYN